MSFNTVPINEATFNQVNDVFLTEYENTPNLVSQFLTVTDQAKTYRWDVQEKVNFRDISPGAAPQRDRPPVRQVLATPKPRASRLASDIFTQATLKPEEITNFTKLQLEALHRDLNSLIFDEVNSIEPDLPAGHVIGSAVSPVIFNVDQMLKTAQIFTDEGVNGQGLCFIISANEQTTLMQDERFANAFYNTVRPLPSGTLVKYVGFDFYIVPSYPSQGQVVTGKLDKFTTGGGGTKIFAAAKDAFGTFFNKQPRFKTWYDDDTFTWLVDCCYQADTSSLRPNGMTILYSKNVS